jgi:hypothetical protein
VKEYRLKSHSIFVGLWRSLVLVCEFWRRFCVALALQVFYLARIGASLRRMSLAVANVSRAVRLLSISLHIAMISAFSSLDIGIVDLAELCCRFLSFPLLSNAYLLFTLSGILLNSSKDFF